MSSFEEGLQTLSDVASADLSASQYAVVKMTTTGLAVAGEGDRPCGVLQDKPDALGRAGRYGYAGVTKVLVGGTVTKGTQVTVVAGGKVAAVGSGDDYVVGEMLGAYADGDIGAMRINMSGPHGTGAL
jgi:hypothetical protein